MELRIVLVLGMAILSIAQTDAGVVWISEDDLETSEDDLETSRNGLETSGGSLETPGDSLETAGDGLETVHETDFVPEYRLEFQEYDVTALQSDVTVWIKWSRNTTGDSANITSPAEDVGNLSVSLQHLATAETVDTLPVSVPAPVPLSVTFPCGSVQQGGRYAALLLSDGRLLAVSRPLLVRWPSVFVSLPSEARSHTPVVAHVRMAVSVCPARRRRRFSVTAQLVVSERYSNDTAPLAGRVTDRYPLRHFYEREHDIRIACSRLERQAFFQLQLAANSTDSPLIAWSNVMRVRWNTAFKLHVRGDGGGSVFPCRAGVEVYFGRPRCAAAADVVRAAGVERAAVASAVPPTTERYVGERRVSGDVSARSFSCDLFSERFVRYCFSYMAFGWSGSVYRVRTVCIPTLPPTLTSDGGFGPWSKWSPCWSSCGLSSRVRYRFCNSPQPRNNGAFCEGDVTQSRPCRLPPCPTAATTLSPVQRAHVSPTCRCGCDVLLARAQNYSLAAASARCPGTSLWRFETSDGSVLSLQFSYFLLNASSEGVQARDGAFSNSELLLAASGTTLPPTVTSSAGFLLLEYRASRLSSDGSDKQPAGGFLASVTAVAGNGSSSVQLAMAGSGRPGISAAGVLSIAFLSAILLVLVGAASYHAWRARLIAKRSRSRESLFSSSSAGGGGGGGGCGGGGCGACSLRTSVTSVAVSAVVLRLRRSRRPRRPAQRSSSCDRLLVDWHRCSTAAGGSLPGSPGAERRRLASRAAPPATKKLVAISLGRLVHARGLSQSQLVEKRPEAAESPEATAKYRPHTKPASKRRKEWENRRRLLVRSESAETLKAAASESALSSALSSVSTAALSTASTLAEQELELDYYDYHMANASLAPGSYFGMDPLQLSLCAYDYDVTPTEELELGEMSELGVTEATEVTEVAEGATDADPLTEVTEADEVSDRTEVGDGIQFADDTDEECSLREDKDSPGSVHEDKD